MEAIAPYPPPLAPCAALEHSAQPEESSDELLAQQARAGVPGALDQLAARYRGRLFAFALAMLHDRDHAEDVAQETLIRAFTALPSYAGRGRFRAWLFRIAANQCHDRRRQQARREVRLDSLPQLAGQTDMQEEVALRTSVFRAVQQLPENYRGPVVLHYMEGFSVAETAAALGRSQTAVRVQLWRARARLAKELSGAWGDDNEL